MEANNEFVFQVDSEIINEVFTNQDNYLVQVNTDKQDNEFCAVYFSSNDLYYPNSDVAFREQLLKKNKFEWYGNRINCAKKHIFIRDIKKQWYLGGINARIDSPAKILEFLREETKGYKIFTVGSSAGGFAAVVFGQQLNAYRTLSFNGQFELISLLHKSTASVNPLVFRNRNNSEINKYYDTRNFLSNPSTVYYFHSNKNDWDISQYNHVKDLKIPTLSFSTGNHGIPFLKSNLPIVLNLKESELKLLTGKKNHPFFFSLKMVGFNKTVYGFYSIFKFVANKIYINTLLKLK